jgi:hypothetical protein
VAGPNPGELSDSEEDDLADWTETDESRKSVLSLLCRLEMMGVIPNDLWIARWAYSDSVKNLLARKELNDVCIRKISVICILEVCGWLEWRCESRSLRRVV